MPSRTRDFFKPLHELEYDTHIGRTTRVHTKERREKKKDKPRTPRPAPSEKAPSVVSPAPREEAPSAARSASPSADHIAHTGNGEGGVWNDEQEEIFKKLRNIVPHASNNYFN